MAIPKTGSISVQFSLGHHDIPEPDLYHRGIGALLDESPELLDFYKFAFVRNPWARFVSLYHDFTMKRGYQYSAKVRHDKPLFGEFCDFEDFCLRVGDSAWMNDIFMSSQYKLLSHNGVVCCDFVGRFENFVSDFETVCSTLGLTATLQHMNKGVYDKSYREYYSSQSRDAVAFLYADDLEAFGYEF